MQRLITQHPAHRRITTWEVVSLQQQEAMTSPGTCALMVGLQAQHRQYGGGLGKTEGPDAPSSPAPVGPTSSFTPSESSIRTQASMGRAMSRPSSCRCAPRDTPYTLEKGAAVIEGEGSAGTRQISGPGSSHPWSASGTPQTSSRDYSFGQWYHPSHPTFHATHPEII